MTHGSSSNIAMAPVVLSIEVNFTSDGNVACLSHLTVLFNTKTSVPPVEIQQELDSILSFAPVSLVQIPHHGYWADYQSLVVVFEECVRWKTVAKEGGVLTSEPLSVTFFYVNDACDWSTPCTKGVCFSNTTGCPVTGCHFVAHSTNFSDVVYYMHSISDVFAVFLAVLIVALASVIFSEWALRGRWSSHLQCVCEDGSPTHCKPALSDIQIPATKPLHKTSPQQISSFPSYKLGLNMKIDLSPKEVNSLTLSQSHMSDTVSSFPATDTANTTLMTPTKPASCISSVSSGEEVNETCSFIEMATTKKKHCGEEIGEEHSDKGGDGAGHVDVLRGARKEDATSDSSGTNVKCCDVEDRTSDV